MPSNCFPPLSYHPVQRPLFFPFSKVFLDIGELFVDTFFNGVYDIGEPFDDIGNGIWDDAESFTDKPDGFYTEGEEFIDCNDDLSICENLYKLSSFGAACYDIDGNRDAGSNVSTNMFVI